MARTWESTAMAQAERHGLLHQPQDNQGSGFSKICRPALDLGERRESESLHVWQ